jgi:murein DD-endopeptidase MepM/ murein hydrolase activator NlpD
VGRVVDPAVRDDGEPEPELTLEGAAADRAEPGLAPAFDGEPALAPQRGGRMRDRLLARARQAEEAEAQQERPIHGDLDEIGQEAPLGDELPPETPSLRAPSAPRSGGRPALSPTLIAIFGTLMGSAVVASLSAVVRHVTPKEHVRDPEPVVAVASSASAAKPLPALSLVKKPARNKRPGPWRIKDAAGDPALRTTEGKIGTDAFLKAVQKIGVSERDAYRLMTAFKGVRGFDKCGKQDRFLAQIERGASRLKAFEYIVGPEEVYQAREGADGLLKASKLDLALERAQVSGSLVYDGTSFDASAERSGFDPGLSKAVSKALDGHSSLEELERGDVVRVIVQEVAVLGDFARYAGVEALEIRRAGKDQPLRVYYFDAAGERGYYDAQGRAPYEGGWRKPIPGAPITSPFNLKRMHPVLKKTMPHLGIDFGSPMGTPVGASSFGTVSFIGYSGPAGNLVKIEHAGGIVTGYAHLSRFAEGLKVGDKVKRLQLVGYVGSTGRSTGPHLHFSAQKNDEFFDAATLNLDGMRTVSKDQRGAFDAVTARYNAALEALPLPPELPALEQPKAVLAAPGSSAAPPTGDPGVEEGDEEPAAPPAPVPAAPSPAPAAVPAKPASGRPSIYLSDKELLEMQGASDDGEVD